MPRVPHCSPSASQRQLPSRTNTVIHEYMAVILLTATLFHCVCYTITHFTAYFVIVELDYCYDYNDNMQRFAALTEAMTETVGLPYEAYYLVPQH